MIKLTKEINKKLKLKKTLNKFKLKQKTTRNYIETIIKTKAMNRG